MNPVSVMDVCFLVLADFLTLGVPPKQLKSHEWLTCIALNLYNL